MSALSLTPARLAAAACLILAAAAPARAGVVFSEDFSGATPGSVYYYGHVSGTNFNAPYGETDVLGVLNAHVGSCDQDPLGNCVKLTPGSGIRSSVAFGALAGHAYTLALDAEGQHVTHLNSTFLVSITDNVFDNASFYATFVSNNAGMSFRFPWTPSHDGSAEIGVDTFTFGSPDVVLSDVVVTDDTAPAPASLPEGGAAPLLLCGLAGLAAARGWTAPRQA